MKGSVAGHLIRKDLYQHRVSIVVTFIAGLAALGFAQRGGEVPVVLGSVWFFVALIVLGSLLPSTAIVDERKKQTLSFLMSLPLSYTQYTMAKIVSNLLMFLVPWATLVTAAFVIVEERSFLPQGAIPTMCILALLPLLGFCLISSTAVISESEPWSIAGTIVCNSSYGLVWYLLARVPAISSHWSSHTPVWNSAVVLLVAGELIVIVLLIATTFFVQSRKRDFI